MVLKEIFFNSNNLKIYHFENLIEIFDENKAGLEHKRKKLVFLDLESHFFYGLVNNVKKFNRFKNSFYKYISFLVKIKSPSSYSDFNKFDDFFVIDINFLVAETIRFKYEIFNQKIKKYKIDLIAVNLRFKESIIRQWSSIVNHWINKKIKFDNFNAFLSTLGGAYSSLGEESFEHVNIFLQLSNLISCNMLSYLLNKAVNARNISKKQLIIAFELNDSNAICRSKLFLAFSFIQLLKFKEANFLLKDVRNHVENEETKKLITDDKISVMCKAGFKKLKFTMTQFKEKKAYFSDRGRLRL